MLDRVTITGADDSVRAADLWALSEEFPFVEWAILFSKPRYMPTPRWPTVAWIDSLIAAALMNPERERPQFAAHLCGDALRSFLLGEPPLVEFLLTVLAKRIQLNTHGEPAKWDAAAMRKLLQDAGYPQKAILTQIDGGDGERLLRDLFTRGIDAYPFFDVSHGAGITPSEWPRSAYYTEGDSPSCCGEVPVYCGYGGGLGPDNLAAEIPRILASVQLGGRGWIDMETKVRSHRDGRDVFDLDKVRRCLEIAAPFVGKG